MNENPEVEQLKMQMERLREQSREDRERHQALAAQVQKLQSVLEKVVDAADANATAFRDTIQILDAKSCVQEAVVRDLAVDARKISSATFAIGGGMVHTVKYLADGTLNMDHYFHTWKSQLVQEEAKSANPYEGAVVFGGEDAQVDEPPGHQDT